MESYVEDEDKMSEKDAVFFFSFLMLFMFGQMAKFDWLTKKSYFI